MSSFFGKHRGRVENNIDPLLMGRLQVSAPTVWGSGALSWAMPCVPFAGPQVGFFFLPPTGANVWIEFEGGDPDYPVWTGGFWGVGECPAAPPAPGFNVLKTAGFTLSVTDVVPAAPLVTIETATGAKISFGPTGIEVKTAAGLVAIEGTQITLNRDALVVLP